MSKLTVLLTEVATGSEVEAELDLDLGPHDLEQLEVSWGPLRREAARKLVREKGPDAVPQHWHWDWRKKGSWLRMPTFRCLGIRYKGVFEGVVLVDADRYRCRLAPDKGKPLMYIKFIEVAPWNNAQFTSERRFTPVGPRLMEAVIRFSESEGYHGRIGLHSLPQSETFYDRCGMSRMDLDEKKQNLRYYEMTRDQAIEFLRKGGRP